MVAEVDELRSQLAQNSWGSIVAGMLRNAGEQPPASLLVTSCGEKEGKTTTAVNLALASASLLKRRTLLVDGNPMSPRLHRLFAVDAEPGLSDLILDLAEPERVIHGSRDPNLAIIPIGSDALSWLEWGNASRLQTELQRFKEEFETIVVDGPSIYCDFDASVYARSFDGVLLVIECEKTRRQVVSSAHKRLNQGGARVLGTVLNRRKYYIPQGLYE